MQLKGKQSYKSQIRTRNKHLLKENASIGTYTTRYSCLSSSISTLTVLQLLQGSSKPLFEKSGKSMLQSQCNYRTPYIPRENSKYRNLPIVVVFLIVFLECICVSSCAEIKNKSELLSGVIESSIGVIVPRDIENVPKENKGNTTSDWIKSDSAISKNIMIAAQINVRK
ncbi:uncharacterized protein LOC111591722 [Ceratitis capitata]|uniref:uncharacterized protein LOC111591722 n=1 Tax=Ceratitis capitata TaxID=7213 RepID=UPI000C6C5E5F|nr:uncharacterized protein LOC111591722 [Ceratitis capitata]